MHVLLSAAAHVMATEGTGIGKPQHLQKVHKKKTAATNKNNHRKNSIFG